MPQVTVYIRSEDMDSWKAVEKKSQFIHEALTAKVSIQDLASASPSEAAKKTLNQALQKSSQMQNKMRENAQFCKHGFPKGLCKYGCR